MNNKDSKKGTLFRLIKMLFSFYPVLLPIVCVLIVISAAVMSIPDVFMQKVIALVETSWRSGDWSGIGGEILYLVGILGALYAVSLLAGFAFNQIMAVVTQGSLKKMREAMFNRMQRLPIRYFDTHNHGDIMSYYTNDIDTLRQMISQSFPQILVSGIALSVLLFIMLYYCIWLAAVVLVGIGVMLFITKKIGGKSAKYFIRQQQAMGREEGYIEEMMNGQKVIKVFCHEDAARADFDRLNDQLYQDSKSANRFANMLMPILNNVGNVLYVIVALAGGIFLMTGIPNVSISGMALSISVAVPFLNITKKFAGNINQISMQINAVVMGLAGARRIFALLDEEEEEDNGYVTLVRAQERDGVLMESSKRTGTWAWKHPHGDGTTTYTKLQGDIRLTDVDFAYEEGKTVLHNISLYAEPGQKVAFVGSTGAGKTTITNLLNRFYDIADGKIKYDGININKIRKSDLRRSLGIVLQDTNLFTGTILDNIRYGNLEADDAACIEAAKIAGAHDFIMHLPEGYQTMLSGNGGNLSQGQRQLLAISRAAVADPPVMIMDEATSSIDTRTEAIIQRGMDALMKGRTVFVIAHRLSTVKNADVIMVLEYGRIIERGSHDKLIGEKGKYYQLYTGAFELE